MSIVLQMLTLLRRVFWLAVVGGAGVAAWSVSRRNSSPPALPPVWPPIDRAASGTPTASQAPEVVADPPVASAPASQAPGPLTWVASEGGACPSSHPIKANSNSRIFHLPGGRFYKQTRAERCYGLEEHAEADGYRRAKS